MKKFLFLYLALSFIMVKNVCADQCVTDRMGRTYCSVYENGGASLSKLGFAFCGRGKCRTNLIGAVYCSVKPGGGAAVDGLGHVRCVDGCEKGSRDSCERVSR